MTFFSTLLFSEEIDLFDAFSRVPVVIAIDSVLNIWVIIFSLVPHLFLTNSVCMGSYLHIFVKVIEIK